MVSDLLEEIASNRHIGIEVTASELLLSKLPPNVETKDEIKSLIREFAVESCYEYQGDRGTKFSTFLYKNLRWKSGKWLRSRSRSAEAYSTPNAGFATSSSRCYYDASIRVVSVRELLGKMSPQSRMLFSRLLDCGADGYKFKTLGSRNIVNYVGCSSSDARKLVREVRKLQGEYF